MRRQKEGHKVLPILIWTEADRLCTQCSGERALRHDWLCDSCRHALERIWQALPLTPKTALKRQPVFTVYTS